MRVDSIARLFKSLLGKAFLQKQRDNKLEGEALWAAVSRAVLNLDEAITHP